MCCKEIRERLVSATLSTDANIRFGPSLGHKICFFRSIQRVVNHMCDFRALTFIHRLMSRCVTEGGSIECLFIDRLNINFRSQFLPSFFLLYVFLFCRFVLFLFCIRHATFFSSLRLGLVQSVVVQERRKEKPDLLNFFLSPQQQFHILPSPFLAAFLFLSVSTVFISQPITVFKSKASENNPHSWLASFRLLASPRLGSLFYAFSFNTQSTSS